MGLSSASESCSTFWPQSWAQGEHTGNSRTSRGDLGMSSALLREIPKAFLEGLSLDWERSGPLTLRPQRRGRWEDGASCTEVRRGNQTLSVVALDRAWALPGTLLTAAKESPDYLLQYESFTVCNSNPPGDSHERSSLSGGWGGRTGLPSMLAAGG